MSIGLTCGHLERGVCFKCAGQTRRFALERAQETAAAIARGAEDAAYARGVADERARVVAWLRAMAPTFKGVMLAYRDALLWAAERINCGEHKEDT